MGTRADFYVGRDPATMEWLGSIAWDGYPDGLPSGVRRASVEKTYRAAVAKMLAGRDDATLPEQGWPWPWANSQTTDYAYAFDGGKVWASCFACDWFGARRNGHPDEENEEHEYDKVKFPDMTDRKKVTLGKRSGILLIGLRKEG